MYTGTGGGTVEFSTVLGLDAAGQVLGYTARYNAAGPAIGYDAWLYSGATNLEIGLLGANYSYLYTGTGGGTFEYDVPELMNNAGQAAGESNRYNSQGTGLGQDAWLYNGSSTTQIGLTGSAYSYISAGTGGGTVEYSDVQFMNDAGQVAGYSFRYNARGANLGQDTWLYSNSGNIIQQIGLTDGVYSYAYTGVGGGTGEYSNSQQLNSSGEVIGYSYRYGLSGRRIGQDAWLYNGTSSQQIGFTSATYYTPTSYGTYAYSAPSQINDAGQVIGNSDRFST